MKPLALVLVLVLMPYGAESTTGRSLDPSAPAARSVQVKLDWTPNAPEDQVALYTIYFYRNRGAVFAVDTAAPPATIALEVVGRWTIYLTATNTAGLTSLPSAAITWKYGQGT